MTTTVMGSVESQGFKATGKVITSPGWRAVYEGSKDEKDEANDGDDKLRIHNRGVWSTGTVATEKDYSAAEILYGRNTSASYGIGRKDS